ncbi:MAG: hypothetical protein IH851_04220 [Armatimonadetes bacterium]|nr:hypothetical protein [Armatimonadota bacterium]
MFVLLTCAALLTASSPSAQSPPAPPSGGQERVNLVRTYEEGKVNTYQLNLVLSGEGAEMAVSADIVMKVEKKLSGGAAQMAVSVSNFTMVRDGVEMSPEEVEQFSAKFDKHGLPVPASIAGVESAEFFYLTVFAGYVPAKEVKVGETNSFTWDDESGTRIEGTSKFEGIETIDGVKAAKLTVHLDISPESGEPGTLDFTSYVEIQSGKLLKADGRLDVPGEASGTVSVKLKKPPTDG